MNISDKNCLIQLFSGTSITDWIIICITVIYVFATILIMFSNRKSEKIAKEQLKESQKQFAENIRLQVLPFLRIDRATKNDEKDLLGREHIVTVDLLCHNNKTDTIKYEEHVYIKNIGHGIAQGIEVFIKTKDKDKDAFPGVFILSPMQSIGSNVEYVMPKMSKDEVETQKIKIQLCLLL